MLGLCWTPATLHSMQKMSPTMPSNPEQLLGAILVRKDIFHRFETTMHDTCLDANNLLEYLFSLYNSTASPAERDNFPSPHGFNFIRRESNQSKRGTGQGLHTFPYQSSMVNSHLLQPPAFQGRLPDTVRAHQSSGHRKKIKLEQSSTQEHVNPAAHHQNYIDSTSSKPVNSNLVFPNATSNPASSIKVELNPQGESCLTQSLTSLPTLNKNHHQFSRSYSPASGRCSDPPTTPLNIDSFKNESLALSEKTSSDIKIEIKGTLQEGTGDQQTPNNPCGSSKHTKKGRRRDSGGKSADANDGSYSGRRRRTHQCFCGAVFTRADNLKRHIRKCHEEKLEKLNAMPLGLDSDNNNGQVADSHSSGQNVTDSSQLQEAEDSQNHQLLRHSQQQDDHQESPTLKAAAAVKWSCFCGESFDDHRQLVEHTRTHDN